MIMHVSLEEAEKKIIIESEKQMSFKCLIINENEINELLKFQMLALTKTESI